MKTRTFDRRFSWLVIVFLLLMPAGSAWALPDEEVQVLTSISPAFKAAEENIVAVWQRIPSATRRKLRASQIEWIKTIRDQKAQKLMGQGYSFAQAYTIVTDNKARELRQYLPARRIKRAEYLALEPNDSRTTASKMTVCGESVTQYFHQARDVDWTRFYARQGADYRVLIHPEDINLKIAARLFGDSDQPLSSNLEKDEENGTWVMRATFEQTGFYFLETAPAGRISGPAAYEIAIRGDACP